MPGHRRARTRGRRDVGFVAAVVLGTGALGLAVTAVTGETDLAELWPATVPPVTGPPPLEVAPTSQWPAAITADPPTPSPTPHDQGE